MSILLITACKKESQNLNNIKLYYNEKEPINDSLIEKDKITLSENDKKILDDFIKEFENIKTKTIITDIDDATEYKTSKELLSFNYKDTRYIIYQIVQSDMSDKQVWFLKTNNNGNEKLYRMSIEDELTLELGKLKQLLLENAKK